MIRMSSWANSTGPANSPACLHYRFLLAIRPPAVCEQQTMRTCLLGYHAGLTRRQVVRELRALNIGTFA